MLDMERREVIALIGGGVLLLAAKLKGATGEQGGVAGVGWVHRGSGTAAQQANQAAAFRLGLNEAGYSESQNVAIEYRWAENQIDRLPALAAELARREVSVIAACGSPAVALAAKSATSSIPIVFENGADPV